MKYLMYHVGKWTLRAIIFILMLLASFVAAYIVVYLLVNFPWVFGLASGIFLVICCGYFITTKEDFD